MHEDSPLWEALQLWSDITGVRLPKDEHDYTGTLGGLSIRDSYVAIKEALELDPTEVTATLLFKHYVETWTKEATTSVADLLQDPDGAMEKVEKTRKLLAILGRPEIVGARESFAERFLKALHHYGAGEREDVKKLLDRPSDMAILRRDALRSLQTLRVDQFLRGEPEPEGTQPGYITVVHEWWNINSLLSAMTNAPSAVSLNLIRDPNDFECFFCFAIRNGGNLYVLSDVGEYAHPLGAQMSRRPDRRMAERIVKNWFPYDLLNLKLNANGEIYFSQWSDETAVVPYQSEANPLKKISEIAEPAELVWTVMMLELIVEKFWRVGYQAKQLSYTGEMIRVENKLLEQAQRIGLPVVAETISAPVLTLADVSADNLDAKQIGRSYDHPNRWMEERYRSQVPETVLNLIGAPGRTLALDHHTGEIRSLTKEETKTPFFDHEKKAARTRTSLEQLPATQFGSAERLEADRRWLARYNLSQHVHDLAGEEFARREKEIKEWYVAAAKENMPALLRYAANGTIWTVVAAKPGATWHHSGGHGIAREGLAKPPKGSSLHDRYGVFDSDSLKVLTHSFMQTHDLREGGDVWAKLARLAGLNLGSYHYRTVQRTRGRHFRFKQAANVQDGLSCVVTSAKASYSVIFYPTTPEELAVIAGCKVEEMPDVLQHWAKVDRYTGNSILDRIDPMTWNAVNPWLKMELRVLVPLSLRGVAKVKKDGASLPPLDVISEKEAADLPVAGTKIMLGGKR